MQRRRWYWICSALLLGCGSSASVTTGDTGTGGSSEAGTTGVGGNRDAAVSSCGATGASCSSGSTCCSGTCDSVAHTCTSTLVQCVVSGGACAAGTDCCSLNCNGGSCSAAACTSDNGACTRSDSCCSGTCTAGTCQPLNTACRTAGNACSANSECCSQLCQNGACVLASSFCIQSGDACSNAFDCCSGVCNIAAGASLGTCGAVPSGSTYCSDGVDGTVCDGCNNCCSRLCAPYGPSGVKVCQPASGCHVNGDLCRKDGDCCGAAGTGLPGDGNVTCEIAPGQAVGICRNPRSCNPEGNVCHFQNYACSISSARNDCCAAVGNSGVCQLDPLGVPRCYGLGDQCRKGGETCASTADCCNQVPCVPDSAGALRCMQPADGGPTCVPRGGSCTINGDCCVGTTCIVALGSTSGTCGTYVPPPVSQDAGAYDAATTYDGGVCALYGQTCTSSADCCDGIPCTGGLCVTPIR